jgi:hypothetical protein
MVTTKNAAATIAAKPAQTTATETKVSAAKLPMIVPEKQEPQPETKKPLPAIEARLKKLQEINDLAERREVVTEAIQNLSGFYISPEGTGCNMRLQDSKGKTFAIAHPNVIGEMVAMAKEKLSTELSRIENLMDFSI